MLELVRDLRLDLPDDEASLRDLVQVRDCDPRTAKSFLSKFEVLRRFYRSPEIIRRIAREAVADAAADHVRYLELRFTPVALAQVGGFPLAEVVDWVTEAAHQAAEAHGVRIGLIASVNRHESVALAERVAEIASDRLEDGVVGLGLAGDEVDFPAELFRGIFVAAREAGLGTTIHAGEWADSNTVRYALEEVRASRIGHGVRVMEDPRTVAAARERGTVFEVCLTSNVHSGAVPRLSAHPLPRMLDAGLQVTLNTDDPGVSGIRLTDEYALAVDQLDLSQESIKGMILAAAQAAFLPRRDKAALEAELQLSFQSPS
jgi:adenosine deaminase